MEIRKSEDVISQPSVIKEQVYEEVLEPAVIKFTISQIDRQLEILSQEQADIQNKIDKLIEKKEVEQLKALAYDQIALIEQTRMNLQLISQEIASRQNPAIKPPPVEKEK
jgi:hypothetical protein